MHRFIKQLRYTAKLINPILNMFNQVGRIALLAMAFAHHPAASAPDLASSNQGVNVSVPSNQAGR